MLAAAGALGALSFLSHAERFHFGPGPIPAWVPLAIDALIAGVAGTILVLGARWFSDDDARLTSQYVVVAKPVWESVQREIVAARTGTARPTAPSVAVATPDSFAAVPPPTPAAPAPAPLNPWDEGEPTPTTTPTPPKPATATVSPTVPGRLPSAGPAEVVPVRPATPSAPAAPPSPTARIVASLRSTVAPSGAPPPARPVAPATPAGTAAASPPLSTPRTAPVSAPPAVASKPAGIPPSASPATRTPAAKPAARPPAELTPAELEEIAKMGGILGIVPRKGESGAEYSARLTAAREAMTSPGLPTERPSATPDSVLPKPAPVETKAPDTASPDIDELMGWLEKMTAEQTGASLPSPPKKESRKPEPWSEEEKSE